MPRSTTFKNWFQVEPIQTICEPEQSIWCIQLTKRQIELEYKHFSLKWFKIAKSGCMGHRSMHVFSYCATIADFGQKKRMLHLKERKEKSVTVLVRFFFSQLTVNSFLFQ